MRSNCKKKLGFCSKISSTQKFLQLCKKKKRKGFCLTSSMVKQEPNLEERILKPTLEEGILKPNLEP